jgi:riboflavin kinase/FMN adenylyltransferase
MGFFDGVHLGHRFLIDETKRIAAAKGLPSMVISFWPHPRTVLQTNYCPQLLTDRFEKEEKLHQVGADYIRTLAFDKALSEMSAQKFMVEILQQELHVKTLVIGFDHRFGNNRSDDFESYVRYGREIGMEVIQATPYVLQNNTCEDGQTTISSSFIRRCILSGKMAEANAALGYIYQVRGTVVGGHQIGRQLGFPTANIEPLDSFKLLPAFGVYAVWTEVNGKRYKGMLDIGRRPTLHKDSDVTIEVHILDFKGDLYQQVIKVGFVERFRADVAFPDVEALVVQLVKDREYVDSLLQF